MKILVFAAVALGAVLSPAYPESFAPGIVTADNVNVRAEPNIRSEIVGQVHQDQPVEVIAMDG
ncbi:MAG: SH3 domain-containing protein, partial [Candidatus Aureabacteria bacterium]|nr:SH3 domain-containing protein [Candidatus Auribacterota bacterium]